MSAALSAAFLDFLHKRALPVVLGTCTDGSMNLQDAGSQSVLVELATLIWTMRSVQGAESTVSYFGQMLPALGWPDQPVGAFVQLLTVSTNPSMFRDNFKQLMRSIAR